MNHTSLNRFIANVLIALWVSCAVANAQSLNHFDVKRNITWATPQNFPLTMDIYTPDAGQQRYPVVVIFHGGGWLIHQKEIMDSLSVYLVSHANYVVCNVNYRLLGDEANSIAINQCVEDALGAVLWVKENISAYRGDSTQIAVTGDSAGGQLAAMVALCGNHLSSQGMLGTTPGFNPTYLPLNTTAEDVMRSGGITVQAALLSYPALDVYQLCKTGFETAANPFWMMAGQKYRRLFADSISYRRYPSWYQAVSPMYQIPSSAQQQLPPQFCMVGSMDVVTPASTIKSYVEKCRNAGQPIEFWEYKGKPHAFLDSKKNPLLGIDFSRDAPLAIDQMITFLNSVFYNQIAHHE